MDILVVYSNICLYTNIMLSFHINHKYIKFVGRVH